MHKWQACNFHGLNCAAVQRLQAVIFDAAGTLIIPRESVGECYARHAAHYGVHIPPTRLQEAFARVFAAAPPNVWPGETLQRAAALEKEWWRMRVRECFRAADQSAAFPDAAAEQRCFETLWLHYGAADAWRVAPDAREALSALAKQGFQLALLSNFDQRLRPLLTQLQLADFFRAVTLPADAGAAKPARQIFDVCLKRLGVAAQRALYIGDHPQQDVAAARAAGLHAIGAQNLGGFAKLPALAAALNQGRATPETP